MNIVNSFNINYKEYSIGTKASDTSLSTIEDMYSTNVQDGIEELHNNINLSSIETYIYPKDVININDNYEFIDIYVDNENKLIESINISGNKTFYTDVTVEGNIKGPTIDGIVDIIDNIDTSILPTIINNEEFLEAHTDATGALLYGINRSGDFIVNSIVSSNEQLSSINVNIRDKVFNTTTDTIYNFYGVNNTPTVTEQEIYFNFVKQNGISIIRADTWSWVDDDHFNNLAYLAKINMNQNNVYLFNIRFDSFGYTNPFESDEAMEAFKTYITNIVVKFNGTTKFIPSLSGEEMTYKNLYFECGNEMDLDKFKYSMSTEQCYKVYKIAYETIKAANPEAIVIIGGLAFLVSGSGQSSYFQGLIDYEYIDTDNTIHKIWEYFDIFNIHFYYKPEVLFEILNYVRKYQINNSTTDEHNFASKPLWITESNYETDDEEIQAYYAVRTRIIAASFGVEKVITYMTSGTSSDKLAMNIYNTNDGTYVERKICQALKTLNLYMGNGATYPKIQEVNNIYIAIWDDVYKVPIVAFWTNDISVDVKICVNLGYPVFIDYMGNDIINNDNIDNINLTINAKPIYMKGVNKFNLI